MLILQMVPLSPSFSSFASENAHVPCKLPPQGTHRCYQFGLKLCDRLENVIRELLCGCAGVTAGHNDLAFLNHADVERTVELFRQLDFA